MSANKYELMTDEDLNREAAERILRAKELAAKWWVWEEDGQKRDRHISAFNPATDRNDSGELVAKMVKYYDAEFTLEINTGSAAGNRLFIPKVTARAETIACLMTLDALEGKAK